MTPGPHLPARKTASLALAILVAMLIVAVVFESGQTPIAYAVRVFGPSAALAALPLLYIAFALRRGPSRSALALGVAYPMATIISFWQAISERYRSGTEGEMDVIYSFVFFWFNRPWMLFLLAFLPALLRLMVVSWRAYRSEHGLRFAPIIGWAAAMLVAMTASRVPVRAFAEDTPEYRPDVVYHPLRDASGRVGAYTLTMRPATYYDYERYQPIPSRTHHRDAGGALHSFGGYRSATDTDPPPADDEMAFARRELASRLEQQRR